MHGLLSAEAELPHSVTALPPTSVDPTLSHHGTGRQLTGGRHHHRQYRRGTFQCEQFEVVRDQSQVDLDSMLIFVPELSESAHCNDVLTVTQVHKHDFKSDSSVVTFLLKKISTHSDFPWILSSLCSRVNIGINLAPGARTREGSCQDQYSDTISSNEKLADLKEKPRTHLQINLQAGYN